MKKETVIRQNRCDQEMKVLLYGCFFLFMAMQLFGGTGSTLAGDRMVRMLCMISSSGFAFLLGYCFERNGRLKSEEEARKWVARTAGGLYVVFFLLALAETVLTTEQSLIRDVTDVITMYRIPSVSAMFFSLAVLLLLVYAFYPTIRVLAGRKKLAVLAGAAAVLCAQLQCGPDSYTITAALFGQEGLISVPAIPYLAYFLLGIWFEEKKPGFQWKLAGLSAAVTAAALILYRTPLQSISEVLVLAFPLYLIYGMAEGLSEVTLRFKAAKAICTSVDLVFLAYVALLFLILWMDLISGTGMKAALLTFAAVLVLIYGGMFGFSVFVHCYEKGTEYFEKKVRHKTAVYFLVYTVIFSVLLFLVFIDFIRFDCSLLWRADGITQYYPRAVYFTNYIRELFSNLLSGNFELPMYDFSLGMGSEITYSLEPLYFLFALFGAENVEFTYTLQTLIRFYLSGISASVLFLYFKKDYFSTFLASVVYVFCGFSLYGGARHTMFMIPMILLPLMVIAIEEIIRGKRWYLCTIFVAVSLFSNYYYLYMNTIGLGIYFLVRFFCQKDKTKKTFKNFMAKGFTIAGTYLLGVGMSCIVLVTMFGQYVSSGRSGAAVIKTPSLFYYSPIWLIRCFLTFLTTANSPGEWMKLGFLPIAYLAVVFLFLRKGRKDLKILTVIGGVLMVLPLSGFVFSGFSSVINRWCYLLALLVAYIVADCYKDMLQMSKREIGICAGWTAVYVFLVASRQYMTSIFLRIAAVCLVLTFLVLLFCQNQNRKWKNAVKQSVVIALTCALVLVNGHTLYSMDGVVKEYTKTGTADEFAGDTPLAAADKLEDDSFYRVATSKLNYSTICSSMLYDYNGITTFYSVFNGAIKEYLESMGSTGYSMIQFFGMNNRTFMNALAAVKYYGNYGESTERTLPYGYNEMLRTEANGREVIFWENENALPLGYTYEEAISREELEAYDVIERQEVLMQKVMLESAEDTGKTDAVVTGQQLEMKVTEKSGVVLSDHALTAASTSGTEDETYSMTIEFEGQPNSETYILLRDAVLKGDMSEESINLGFYTEDNNLTYTFRSDDDRYGTGQENYVFNLGYHEEAITSCTITMSREGVIDFESFEVYSQPMDNTEEYTRKLTEDVLENISIETNRVSGTISLDQDKILVLSIPYQNGWTAYVDGEQVELERANYMYMALDLEAGDHTIELKFAIPGVKYALVIMPSSAALFLGLCAVTWIRNRSKKKIK